MKDVAARAGVGLKTVSRVVNEEPGVTPDTVARVQAAIDALGFRRNDSARLLRTRRTSSVGLVLEDLADPFYAPLSRAVEDVARAHGALLFTGSSAEDPRREQELVLAFCARRVDGLIVVPAGDDHRYLTPEIEAGVATVFVDRPAGRIDADVVLTDNAGGTRDGVAHLIAHGHRRIAFIGDQSGIHTAAERLRGYREAMAAAGLPIRPEWCSMGPTTPDRVRAVLGPMLAGPEPVTALFAGNNRVTVTAVRVLSGRPRAGGTGRLRRLRTRRPAQPGGHRRRPGLPGLGRSAAQLLFRRLDGIADDSPRRVELACRLIARGSGEIPPHS